MAQARMIQEAHRGEDSKSGDEFCKRGTMTCSAIQNGFEQCLLV